MSAERKVIVRKATPDITLPKGVIPNEEEFLRTMYDLIDQKRFSRSKGIEPSFGHALSALALSRLQDEETDPIRRQNTFRKEALALVEQFGEKIIPLLRDELKIALDTK